MDLPPSSHFIYIPLILTLGVVFGFVWGARLTRESVRLEAKHEEEKLRKRAERAAAKAAAAAEPTPGESPQSPPK